MGRTSEGKSGTEKNEKHVGIEKIGRRVILLAFMSAFLISCSQKELPKEITHREYRLERIEQAEDGSGNAVFDGVTHHYILDLPKETKGAPVIVMLHGYGESAESFRQKTAFEQDANPLGYAVVYVTGAPAPEDPTSSTGWNSGIGVNGNRDVDFLCALVNDLCEQYEFDKNCVFAVGFSNGAFMTHRLAIEANDVFAAVVSVAGMMPESIWEKRLGAEAEQEPEKLSVGVLQITGEKDDVVPKNSDGSAKFAKAPAIEEVMEYYVTGNGLALSETVNVGKKSVLEKYSSTDSAKQVWNLFIPDGRHSWPEERIVGFHTNKIVLDFLSTQ